MLIVFENFLLFINKEPRNSTQATEACREDYEGKDREISKRSGTKNPPRIRLVDVGDVIKKIGGYFRGIPI